MRIKLVPAILAASLAMAGAAYAATTTVGVVKSFDLATKTVTLEDGTMYRLPMHFTDPGLKIGERVSVVWDKVGSIDTASAVSIVKS